MAPRFTRLSKKNSLSARQIVLRTAAFCTLIFVFGAGLVVVGLGPTAAPAEAKIATGGDGKHKSVIEWADWGSPTTTALANPTTSTSTRTVQSMRDGVPVSLNLVTTCTVSNILNGTLKITRPGAYTGDGLDNLYNTVGAGGNNGIVSGLANLTNAGSPDFEVRCNASLAGQPVPLSGLVVADAESTNGMPLATNGAPAEYIDAVSLPDSPLESRQVNWRIIDRYRTTNCGRSALASVNSERQMRLTTNATSNESLACAGGPMAVAFMESPQGVSTTTVGAKVTVKGQGTTAVAVGVVLGTDYGDAPASYGVAGSVYSPRGTGGAVNPPTTSQDLWAANFTLADFGQPTRSLGTRIDSEGVYPSGAVAGGDDATGPDEDGFNPANSLLKVTPGEPYTTPSGAVTCSGTGWVAGWIDWNRNGAFEGIEKSAAAPCANGGAALSWTVPANAVQSSGTTKTFLRLRMTATEAEVASPVGVTLEGEVEDHAVNVELPQLRITKTSASSSGTVTPRPGDVITYTVTANNIAETAFTAGYPAVVTDDLSGVLDDAAYNNNAVAAPTGVLTYSSPRLQWSGALGAKATVTITYSVRVGATGDGRIRNVAFAGTGNTPSCASPVNGVDPSTGTACAQSNVLVPRFTVQKSADPASGGIVNPAQKITYTLSFQNTGGASGSVDYADILAGLVDDASIDKASLVAAGGVTGRWEDSTNRLLVGGTLAPSQTGTLRYTATVKTAGFGDAVLRNFLVAAGNTPPATCPPTSAVCTEHRVKALWDLAKTASPPSGSFISPGDEVQYQVTASGKGGSVAGVVLRDNIGDVIDDANFVAGSARLSVNGAAPVTVGDPVNGTLTTPSFNLGINATATLSYRVQVKPDAWSRTLRNTVGGMDASQTGPTTCAVCTTTHQTTARVIIEKVGESSNGTWVRMQGSAWELFRDSNGSVGASLMTADAVTEGLFSLNGLPAGSYWLAETQAPVGFSLLAEPVKFSVAADGSVTLGAGGEGGVATTTIMSMGPDAGRSVITVRDVPALVLPESGGAGTKYLGFFGAMVLVLFAALAAMNRKREIAGKMAGSSTTKFP